MDWTPFLRQLYVCTGLWIVFFMQGLIVGLPTVMIPQLRRDNQTITDEQASWFTTVYLYSGIPWVIVQSVLITIIGQKKTHIIVCSSSFVGFIIFYFSSNFNQFLIGGIFQGVLPAAVYTTVLTMITECTSSKYRGVFLTVKSASFYWGVLLSNTIGTFFHWQNIIVLGLVSVVYTLLNVIIWPESPLWLASKGKFAECAAAHRWLKGDDETTEKELVQLLKAQEKNRFVNPQLNVRYVFVILKRKQYLKPVLLSVLLICLYNFSGKLVCTIYAIEILKKISSSESTAYSRMLILDGVTVICMYLGCILSKFLKRRVILLGFSIIGTIIMFTISAYLYLVSLSMIKENNYVSVLLLVTYSIAVSCGPIMMSATIVAELLPLESRIVMLCIIGMISKLTLGTFAKLSPLCFKNLGIHGTFLLFAIISGVCLILIYFYLPETKDKTLQEIDACLRGEENDTKKENDELININR